MTAKATQANEKLFERPAPCDPDAERIVLGSIMIDPVRINDIRLILDPEDFYFMANGLIYSAILSAFDANQTPEPTAIKKELRRKNKLEEVGGIKNIIAIMDSVVTTANVMNHAKTIKKKAKLREAIKSAYTIADMAYSEDDADIKIREEIARLSKGILQTSKRPYWHISDLAAQCSKRIEDMAMQKESAIGIKTGFYDFDALAGGLIRQDLIIIAARPSMGKTSLATNIAMNMAENGQTVLIFSCETSKEQIMWRMLVQKAKVNSQHFKNGHLTQRDWEKIMPAFADLSEMDIYVDDTAGQTPSDLIAKSRILSESKGNLSLVIVDYLQLLRSGARTENRTQEVTAISQGLKMLAKEIDCPIIALSQLSREVEKRTNKRPKLADLRESGAIEQDADIVAFIYRPEVYDKDSEERGIAEIIIEKQRNGPTGSIKLAFLADYMCFENLIKDWNER